MHKIDNEINNWGSFAILYRTHKQSEAFETQLKNSNIPYKIIGKIKFLEREIIVHITVFQIQGPLNGLKKMGHLYLVNRFLKRSYLVIFTF